MGRTNAIRIYLLVFLLVIVWGLSWPISKMGLAFMPPIWYATFRLLIGMISIFLMVAFEGKIIIPHREDVPIILVFGLLQMALFISLISVGLRYVDAGRSAMLVYTTPIWVTPLAVFFFHEKLTVYNAAGFLLGMLGILILFSPAGIDWSNKAVLLGNGLLLLAAVCWAISILCARNMKWHHTPLEIIPWQLLLSTIVVFIVAYLYQPTPQIIWNRTLILSLLFTGILAVAFGFWGSLVVSKELPSITASLCFLAIPVAGLIFSAFLLHEPITLALVCAMSFILCGIACVAWGSYIGSKV